MDRFDALILGLVEGATEFLPVSSTGHLILISDWLGIDQTSPHIAFQIVIQFAAILAIFSSYQEKLRWEFATLWLKVTLAFLPIAVVGFFARHQVEALFANPFVVPVMFIIGGIVFLVLEFFQKQENEHTKALNDISFSQAGWIGFTQIFALIPGTSRAGSTIVGALLVGLNRKVAAEFSFLLALPVLGAASSYQALANYEELFKVDIASLGIGLLAAFFSAWLTIKLFIQFLQRFTFVAFGIYRIILGILILSLA